MTIEILATDFDGTIANEGIVNGPTLESLQNWRAQGRRLLLVTGRELEDLKRTFHSLEIFNAVVAENGAILYWPIDGRVELLAPPPDVRLVKDLTARGVKPLSVGHCIVATWEPHQTRCLESIRTLGLELQVIFNKTAVMILPSGINKASGTLAALERLNVDKSSLAGIGDAENDSSLLEICSFSAAVSNAVPSLQERADMVTKSERGAGVVEFINFLLSEESAHL